MNKTVKFLVAAVFVCVSLVSYAQDQQGPHRGGRFADLQRVFGTLESVSPDKLVIKGNDGTSTTVKITSETQFRKDRQPAKMEDFKAGDRVIAAGKTDSDGVLVAQFVAAGMRGGPGMGGPGGGPGMGSNPPSPEEMARMGLGTRFIAGEVKKIEDTKLTILRPDNQTQVIEVDENTSFRNNANESVTLADVKVGDHVAGRGEMKNGVFVPQVLRVGVQFPQRQPNNNQ
jgi:preprotein translocase subunit YajC